MSDIDKISSLHEQCKNLNSDEIIVLLIQIKAESLDEKLVKIFKTYLVRQLLKEGFR